MRISAAPKAKAQKARFLEIGRTVGATVSFAAAVICGYLAAVLVLRRLVLPRLPVLSSPALRGASAAHNAVLLTLSAYMAAGCALSTVTTASAPRWAWPFCFPPWGTTEVSGPIFFWAHVFYLSKVYELGDTLLILLAHRASRFPLGLAPSPRKRNVWSKCWMRKPSKPARVMSAWSAAPCFQMR
ncbi:hypothetical protein ZEAMMB73_Zm00001d015874 [Zea mays]|uniref:very-long-chain 3-oxoacyl-CoA synthase n=1 Tax=Zea mays TaxID=4577 RepID=A0A1D6H4G8_MAIZE|nr:hypothetical protein ZEAMMB73_Zm00001d015874 [Zea mays]